MIQKNWKLWLGIGFLMGMTGVVACQGQGSNDVGQFVPKAELPGTVVTLPAATDENGKEQRVEFSTVYTQVLEPKCVVCHEEMVDPVGVSGYLKAGVPEESELYTDVVSGRMPRKRPKLSDAEIDLIRRYILGVKET